MGVTTLQFGDTLAARYVSNGSMNVQATFDSIPDAAKRSVHGQILSSILAGNTSAWVSVFDLNASADRWETFGSFFANCALKMNDPSTPGSDGNNSSTHHDGNHTSSHSSSNHTSSSSHHGNSSLPNSGNSTSHGSNHTSSSSHHGNSSLPNSGNSTSHGSNHTSSSSSHHGNSSLPNSGNSTSHGSNHTSSSLHPPTPSSDSSNTINHTPAQNSTDSRLGKGAIAGIVVGSVAGAALVGGAVAALASPVVTPSLMTLPDADPIHVTTNPTYEGNPATGTNTLPPTGTTVGSMGSHLR
jgi:hypothetical protein